MCAETESVRSQPCARIPKCLLKNNNCWFISAFDGSTDANAALDAALTSTGKKIVFAADNGAARGMINPMGDRKVNGTALGA